MKTWLIITLIGLAAIGYWLSVRITENQATDRGSVFLSTFLPHAGGCGWYRTRLPDGQNEPIVRFHVDCGGISMAWHSNFQKAVVWTGGDMDLMAWLVNIQDKQSDRLPPLDGDAKRFFFTSQGRVAVIVEHATETDAMVQYTFEWTGSRWHENRQLRFVSPPDTNPLAKPDVWQVVTDKNLHSQLDPLISSVPERVGRKWRRYSAQNQGYALLTFATVAEIPNRLPALLRFEHKGQVQVLPQLDFRSIDSVSLASHDRYLLVVDSDSRMSPQVFDWTNGRIVYESKPAHLVEFWPTAKL